MQLKSSAPVKEIDMAEFGLIRFGRKNYAPHVKYAHIKIKNILFAKNFVYNPLNL